MAKVKKKALTSEERLAQVLVPKDEQPYTVPENWMWVKLPAVCEYIRAGGDKPKIFSKTKSNEHTIPVVANGVNNDGIVGYTDVANEKENTVTVSGRGTIGFSLLREYSYCPIVRLIVVSPNILAKPHFLKMAFDNFLEEGVGSSIPQLTVPMIKEKRLPLPPLSEQHRIVARIERLFEKLDHAKALVQSSLDSFENRKAAILHKAFTGELTAVWREQYGFNLNSWQERNLQSLCSMKITDGTHQTPTYCDEMDGGIPFISSKDVKTGVIDWTNIKYIPQDLHEKLHARLAPQRDDVLLAKNGTTGMAAIVDTDLVFDIYVTLAVLRPNGNDVLPRFLLQVVNSPICKMQFDENLTGIGVPNLHLRDIKEVKIQLPTLPEQEEIVRIVDNLLENEKLAQELTDTIEKIDHMKKAILARAFRGELGTNDPNEESAKKLLVDVVASLKTTQ